MARLCIRIAPNDTRSVLRDQPGDVVDIQEDSHAWSAAERNCGQYRFIDVTGASVEALANLVAVKREGRRILARRIVSLDVTALRSGQWGGRTTATKTQIDAITITRA